MPQLSTSHVFISYSRRDTEAMLRIVAFLRGQNIKVWVDNEKLTPGTPIWEEEIEKAIKGAFAIVVVLSPDSKNSEWVRREVTLGDQFRKRVFPVLVAGSEEDSIPLRLITRQFVDVRTNEEAGLHSLKMAISFYLEELAAQEEKEREEAEKLARAEEELKAAEQEAERLRLENEAAEKAAREAEEKAAREKTEKEAFKREAIRLELERKASAEAERLALEKAEIERAEREAAEEAERIALDKANKEKIEREAAEQEATQLKAERSAAQKNIFSRMGYAWASWSTQKKIFITITVLVLGLVFSCGLFFAYSFIQTMRELSRPTAPVQLIMPGNNPSPISQDEQPTIVYDLAFSPDGQSLASVGGIVEIWDTNIGSRKRNIEDFGFAVAFSPDGKIIASSSASDIRLWSLDDNTLPATLLSGHTETVWDLAFSPDGKYLASASWDDTIRIWNTGTGTAVYTLEGHSGDINSVAFSPDGSILVSGSKDTTIRFWDTSNGELINTLQENTSINGVTYSSNGKFAIATDDGIKLMDGKSFQVLFEINESYARCIDFSPDGNTIAVGMINNSILLIDTGNGEVVNTLSGHTNYINSVAFSPDGKLLASSAADSTIRLWEITP